MNQLIVEIDPREESFDSFITKDNRLFVRHQGNNFLSESTFKVNETGIVEPVSCNGATLGIIRVNGEVKHYLEYMYTIKKFKKC